MTIMTSFPDFSEINQINKRICNLLRINYNSLERNFIQFYEYPNTGLIEAGLEIVYQNSIRLEPNIFEVISEFMDLLLINRFRCYNNKNIEFINPDFFQPLKRGLKKIEFAFSDLPKLSKNIFSGLDDIGISIRHCQLNDFDFEIFDKRSLSFITLINNSINFSAKKILLRPIGSLSLTLNGNEFINRSNAIPFVIPKETEIRGILVKNNRPEIDVSQIQKVHYLL